MIARLQQGLLDTWRWEVVAPNGQWVASCDISFATREECLAHLSGAAAMAGLSCDAVSESTRRLAA